VFDTQFQAGIDSRDFGDSADLDEKRGDSPLRLPLCVSPIYLLNQCREARNNP
jgi:hypothetical protein